MIRLLWLFLILDVAVSVVHTAALFYGSETASENLHDVGFRITIELAALAIIEAVRERKV